MRFIFTDIPADMISALLAIAILLSGIFFVLRYKKIETRKWFIASILVSTVAVLLLFFVVPFFHANDQCSIGQPCQDLMITRNNNRNAIYAVCPDDGAFSPCFLAIDAICIIMTIISVIMAIASLIKTRKIHHKIWPYIVAFLIALVMATLFVFLISIIGRSISG